ncbi:hypothetical protein [Nocardia sp. NPDC127526]|uniref:hypothetical protein n=1 Tax=Nocardia sp. NPDC127526 TaxID=3345393 RepID=UPI00362A9A49
MRDDKAELIVVDAANVVGSRPDGWWRDRAGAARRLLLAVSTLRDRLDYPVDVVVVLEGAAKAADPEGIGMDGVRVVLAAGSGDDAIADTVTAAAAQDGDRTITVVTADRGLRNRVEAAGAGTVGPRWLLDRIES